jgi:hypothetical protein
MAQTRTADEIATNALETLGAVSVGETPAAEDLALAKRKLDDILADFAQRGIVYVGDVDEVPMAVALHLGDALAIRLIPKFGGGQVDLPSMSSIEGTLRQISSVAASREPVRADYF